MSKDDILIPASVPRKRRHLESALDLWLAVWATDERLSLKDRQRAQEERHRRKALKPDCVVGLLIERQGVTPEQLAGIKFTLAALAPTEIAQTYVPTKVHTASKQLGVPITMFDYQQDVVKASDVVIAAPRTMDTQTPKSVWEMVKYAKHRSIEPIVIPPDWSGV